MDWVGGWLWALAAWLAEVGSAAARRGGCGDMEAGGGDCGGVIGVAICCYTEIAGAFIATLDKQTIYECRSCLTSCGGANTGW